MKRLTKVFIIFFSLLGGGCSSPEQSEQEKIKGRNAKGEFIYRQAAEKLYPTLIPKHRLREGYPWEQSLGGNIQRITKEFLRCKGSSLNPIKKISDGKEYLVDCTGGDRHSLPLRQGKEFIHPILLELLNHLQEQSHRQVIITCGHQCPIHNRYVDEAAPNQYSKHQIGAEVDFYIQDRENQPEEVVKLLLDFYKNTPRYAEKKEYQEFLRDEKNTAAPSTLPWYNKEIYIKLFKKDEGRDFDNRHPYPYITIQVRFDRDTGQKVTYSWDQAFKGYMRN